MNSFTIPRTWKKIKELNSKYEISNYGEVRNAETLKIIKSRISNSGYLRTYLRVPSGKAKWFSNHRDTGGRWFNC